MVVLMRILRAVAMVETVTILTAGMMVGIEAILRPENRSKNHAPRNREKPCNWALESHPFWGR